MIAKTRSTEVGELIGDMKEVAAMYSMIKQHGLLPFVLDMHGVPCVALYNK